ncbi:MAG: hypothetical protein GY757_44105, partial [bacterium]|nr:hypothetical protein [bacterium]
GILAREFMALYEEKALPPLEIQYKDYTHWQQSKKQTEAIKRQEAYWQEQYRGAITPAELPYDRPRPETPTKAGRQIPFEMGTWTVLALKNRAQEENVTLYILLLALFNILISKLTGKEDVVIGTPVAGRRHEALAGVIGMFVNTLAIRNYPRGEISLKTFFKEVGQRTIKAFENQE